MERRPEVEWCLQHLRHEQIPACEPEVALDEYMPEPIVVEFNDTALGALDSLFELIHWDDLAKSYWRLLPDNLLDELTTEFRPWER